MRFIFCADYRNPRAPDSAYEAEVDAVERLHFNYSLINIEALIEQHNASRAVKIVEPAQAEETAIYRGWMLKPDAYTRLFTALAQKGLTLINTPEAYTHCHYLPASYHLTENMTARSTWLNTGHDVSMDEVMQALSLFGDRPVLVKDFVKSRKHEWNEACYIPHASDRQAVERVVTRFLQLQGEDLNEGLVFREFVEFEPLVSHSKSGMPLIKEFRLFVLDGQIIFSTPYWEEGNYNHDQPPIDMFRGIAQTIQSRFFTMDVARKLNGTWNIIELGDGQVAGLPARANPKAFYQTLISTFPPIP